MYKYIFIFGVNSLFVDDEGIRVMNEGMELVNNIIFFFSFVFVECRDIVIRIRFKFEFRSISRFGIFDSDLNVFFKGSSNVVCFFFGG